MPFVDASLLFVALGRLAVYLVNTFRVEEVELRVWLLANLVKWMDIEPVFFGPPTESANAINQLLVALLVEVGLSAKEHHAALGD